MVSVRVWKKREMGKNRTRTARMVLLENFRAEPLSDYFWRPNRSIFVCLLP
jgi:hypothetical protein